MQLEDGRKCKHYTWWNLFFIQVHSIVYTYHMQLCRVILTNLRGSSVCHYPTYVLLIFHECMITNTTCLVSIWPAYVNTFAHKDTIANIAWEIRPIQDNSCYPNVIVSKLISTQYQLRWNKVFLIGWLVSIILRHSFDHMVNVSPFDVNCPKIFNGTSPDVQSAEVLNVMFLLF